MHTVLSQGYPTHPHTHTHTHSRALAQVFFEALQSSLKPEVPVWVGELYLELHRGTYTTQGRIKRYNRELE